MSTIPSIGLGTYCMKGEECANAVNIAIRCGYRHIDTASVYQNEQDVAEGIRRSGIPRSEIFITSKLQPRDHGKRAYDACLVTLKNLNTEYLDLYLIHFPGVAGYQPSDIEQRQIRRESWLSLQRLKADGYCKEIGVSNYTANHLEDICNASVATEWGSYQLPYVNQFELSPMLQQNDIVQACRKFGIQIESYSTLARGHEDLLMNETILEIVNEVGSGATAAQICLSWALHKGFIVIPKSTRKERIEENFASLQIKLTTEQIVRIDSLETTQLRTCWDPTRII